MDFRKTNKYYVSNVYYPSDSRTNDFENIKLILIWNLTIWSNDQLDHANRYNNKFICKISNNEIGTRVNSSTYFHVECMSYSNLFFCTAISLYLFLFYNGLFILRIKASGYHIKKVNIS